MECNMSAWNLCLVVFFCACALTVYSYEETSATYLINNARPPPSERKFVSPVIDSLIANISARMKDPILASLFTNCLPNTLDTTVMNFTYINGTPDTFVITGDIPAMWIRDTTNQVFPYLPYATQDRNLQQMILGVLLRQARSILIDSYANAFIDTYIFNITSPWKSDIRYPPFNASIVWEGKYELDSLAAFLRLSYYYYYYTNDTTPLNNSIWRDAVYKVVETIQVQQLGTAQDNPPAYYFQRMALNPTDTLLHGTGTPANYTGMAKSGFRPSDDASMMPFPIAANSMTVVALLDMATLFEGPAANASFVSVLKELAAVIQQGINYYGILQHPVYGSILAYEVDGYGNTYAMDDANIPSLLSLPYLGIDANNALIQNTRKFVLSPYNPYYFSGSVASGIGGPHVGYGYIWPMAIMMQAQTSDDDTEIMQCLEWLKVASAGTGFMHESFNMNNVTDYTRSWFAWANSQFGELILTLVEERPYLLFNATETSSFEKPKAKKKSYSIFGK